MSLVKLQHATNILLQTLIQDPLTPVRFGSNPLQKELNTVVVNEIQNV